MDVGLDVVIQQIAITGVGEFDQPHTFGRAHVDRVKHAIGIAEARAREGVGIEAQVRRTEAWRAASRPAAVVVERTVDRPG